MGVEKIVVNGKNKCPLSPTVSKVSAGALEFIDIHMTNDVKGFFTSA